MFHSAIHIKVKILFGILVSNSNLLCHAVSPIILSAKTAAELNPLKLPVCPPLDLLSSYISPGVEMNDWAGVMRRGS